MAASASSYCSTGYTREMVQTGKAPFSYSLQAHQRKP